VHEVPYAWPKPIGLAAKIAAHGELPVPVEFQTKGPDCHGLLRISARNGQLMELLEMKIATKLGLLFAGMIIVFILLGITLLAQMKTVSNGYDAVLASPVHDIDSARVVQVNFKKEVQEWKDTL
jgi:hypothetical protein